MISYIIQLETYRGINYVLYKIHTYLLLCDEFDVVGIKLNFRRI